MQVEVFLLVCESSALIAQLLNMALRVVLGDGQRSSVCSKHVHELRSVLLLHYFFKIALGSQEDLQLLRHSKIS